MPLPLPTQAPRSALLRLFWPGAWALALLIVALRAVDPTYAEPWPLSLTLLAATALGQALDRARAGWGRALHFAAWVPVVAWGTATTPPSAAQISPDLAGYTAALLLAVVAAGLQWRARGTLLALGWVLLVGLCAFEAQKLPNVAWNLMLAGALALVGSWLLDHGDRAQRGLSAHAESLRTLAEQERERAEEFRALAELGEIWNAHDEPDTVAQRAIHSAAHALGADAARYFTLARGAVLEWGDVPHVGSEAVRRLYTDPRPAMLGMAAAALQRGSVLQTADYAREPYALPEFVAAGLRAAVFAPVVLDSDAQGGFVCFLWFRPLPVLPRAAGPLAARTAELIGRALERRAALRAVEATREGALIALGLALEARDFETAGHTARVVALSSLLGGRLGLGADDLEGLRQGAYLHDIGKLTVPDVVLLKPGRLTGAEWEEMRAHAGRGADLVAHIPTLHPRAAEVVRHHHERWDGQGYPGGLSGEAIPLAARVFAACDVYDALTSFRPYKYAWSAEEARGELRRQAGVQFDPRVVTALLEVLEEGTPARPAVG